MMANNTTIITIIDVMLPPCVCWRIEKRMVVIKISFVLLFDYWF